MRIAFVQSARVLSLLGGVATSVENFLDYTKSRNILVDLILDKNSDFVIDFKKYTNVRLIYPPTTIDDKTERQRCGMYRFALPLEQSLNFRNSLLLGLTTAVYDAIILNSEEALEGIVGMGLDIPTYVYTHSGSIFGNDTGIYDEFNKMVFRHKNDVVFLTQNEDNKKFLTSKGFDRVEVLPLQQSKNIVKMDIETDGILFNGRNSTYKNFDAYLSLIKKTGKKAKILMPKTKKDISKVLKEKGIYDFEIGSGLTGESKIRFMNSAECCFHPSKTESFGYAPAESLKIHDVYVLKKYPWTKNIIELGAVGCSSIDDVIEKMKTGNPNRQSMIDDFYNSVDNLWDEFFETLRRVEYKSSGYLVKSILETMNNNLSSFISDTIEIPLSDLYLNLDRQATYGDIFSIHKQIMSRKDVDFEQRVEGTYIWLK